MKKKTCGIYKITSITGRIYIGQSVKIEYRWMHYKKNFAKGQPKLNSSLKKHGHENHTFEIIEECIQELLNEREIHWIKHFDTFDTPHGMNLKIGGEQGLMSEETIKKMSEAQKGNKRTPFTEVHLKNMSEAQKKREPPTEETKKKISLTLKSRPLSEAQINQNAKPKSEETKKKISDKLKGRPPSEETCKKISNKMTGVPKSPESITKRTKTRAEKRKIKEHAIQSIIFRSKVLSVVNFKHTIFEKTNET